MSQLRDMEHREMVDELNRKISQLETEVHYTPSLSAPPDSSWLSLSVSTFSLIESHP